MRILPMTLGLLSILPCAANEPAAAQGAAPAAPAQTPGSFSLAFPAPVPSLPVPMDLKDTESVTLAEFHIMAVMRQHEAMLHITMVVECPDKFPAKPVPVAIPFQYVVPDDAHAALAPVHRLPFAKAVSEIEIGANGLRMDYSIIEGRHPQGDAPSLQSVAGANYWLTGKMRLKPGRNTMTFNITIPYVQTISGSSGRQAQTGISASTLDLNLATAGAWAQGLTKADIDLYAEEMLPNSLKILETGRKLQTAQSEQGVIMVNLLDPEGNGTMPGRFAVQVGSPYQFAINAEDLPDRIERLKTIQVNGKRMGMTNNYSVSASSTLPQTMNGEASSPDNLKTGRGFWAEHAAGDGEGESVTLTLDSPQQLAGLIIQPGASPLILGRNDPEALRYPDIAYSLHSRPRTVKVSLNDGAYTFKATLRDDWNPQLIEIPYFTKSVKTINVAIEKTYKGAASDDAYITTILPVVQ